MPCVVTVEAGTASGLKLIHNIAVQLHKKNTVSCVQGIHRDCTLMGNINRKFPILCAKFQFHITLSISDSCFLIKAWSFAIDSVTCNCA